MKSQEIRRIFLEYFEKQGHKIIPSSSLIPHNDPTLFFVNAGMVPFKDVFTGQETLDCNTATTVQRCLRVSGKHNDLEEVGRTPRHHTFFEMMGNFSFGDYFKREAITHAWTLLTEHYQLDPEKLWVTVFEEDDEAEELWKEISKLPARRIQRMGAKDNFWSMGDTGPCGPCSEIHYDHGPEYGDDPNGPAGETNRYVEIWNLVFMQYDRDASGNMTPLPNPSIDTGMGLERLAAIKQGVYNNYDTDIFQSVIHTCAKLAGVSYGDSDETNVALRVIADHTRAVTFAIADGVMPSNEGRGYVLRRIARRAIRYGVKLGLTETFLHKCAAIIIQEMGAAYPIIERKQNFILEVIETEESRFRETLDRGLAILEEAFEKHTKNAVLSGEIAFQLHDTFGFPLDLTQLIASERNISIDEDSYNEHMAKQKAMGRANWKGASESTDRNNWQELAEQHQSVFLGYDQYESNGTIIALINEDGESVSSFSGKGSIILNQTPFYGESGGQVGDVGHLELDGQSIRVTDTQKPAGTLIEHKVDTGSFNIAVGQNVIAKVDIEKRKLTRRNHTATHLLHSALRQVLGDHVTQKGSLVSPHRLRFDFSHHKAVSTEELEQIQHLVQQEISANTALIVEECSMDAAKEKGAMALFGEKYGDEVRVVEVPGFSVELCGGTHAQRTGEITLFNIISEGGIAAGIRRIEALTSSEALQWYDTRSKTLDEVANTLRAPVASISEQVDKLLNSKKALEKEIQQLRAEIARLQAGDLLEQIQEINGMQVIIAEFNGDMKALREEASRLRDQLTSGVVVLGSTDGGVQLLAAVTKDLAGKKVHAGKLIQQLATNIQGGGGGRPDMAQAGGKDPSGLPKAFEMAQGLLNEMNG